jgi:outer membrane protein assembly factor BamB
VLQVGNLLLATTESGEIVLIDPSPEGLRERTRFRVLTGKTWNPPALAGDFLVVRHDREAACFRLPIQ